MHSSQPPHRDNITSRHDYIQLAKGGNHCAEFAFKCLLTVRTISSELHMYYNSYLIRYVGITEATQVICRSRYK